MFQDSPIWIKIAREAKMAAKIAYLSEKMLIFDLSWRRSCSKISKIAVVFSEAKILKLAPILAPF